MSTKDKTRQKLMGSMRKNKEVAGIGTDSTQAKTPVVSPDVSGQTKQPVISKARGTTTQDTLKRDAYQTGRRVWPD
jgi:hypothetical protein